MEDTATTIGKERAMKWFETDHSDDPSFSIKDYECLTMAQYSIEIKSKVPLDYIRYVNWRDLVIDRYVSKKIMITAMNKKAEFNPITKKESDKLDGGETWLFVIRKVN